MGISAVALEGELSGGGTVLEPALQARYLAVLRERRDNRLWLVALISAIASALSAAAAWIAVLAAHS